MTCFKPAPTFALTLSLAVSATAAFADLTPEQVWEDWKSYLGGFGYEVTGEPSQTGTILSLSDMGVTMQAPDNSGSVSMRLEQVQMIGNDDGSVSVVLPERMPVAITALDPDGKEVTTTLEIAHQGLNMTVSGTPERMRYDYRAKELSMELTDLLSEGESVGVKAAQIRFADMSGNSQSVVSGTLRALNQTMTAGPVSYELDVNAPENGGRLVLGGKVAQATFDGQTQIPQSFDANDMAANLLAGFRFDSRFKYQTGSSSYRFEEGSTVIEGTQGSDSGQLTGAIGPDGLRYGGEGRNFEIAMSGTDLPFPVTLDMARFGFEVAMPVAKSDDAQDFAVKLDLTDFTMSDMIWALFDPGQKLPRDPATIALDLSGKGRLFYDLLDPATAKKLEVEGTPPGQLETLDLNNFMLSVAGAKLTGEGAFVFDQNDLTSFEGMAAPEGAIDLKLLGGNTLLDKLIAMGLLPQQQATGFRMMMGLFAVPGEGEDTLSSRIEFTQDGQVLANGQRLK